MKFIYADSLDFVDPGFDFLTDSHTEGRKPYWDDLFPHEILAKSPYDGILVSRAIVGDHLQSGKYSESQSMRFRRVGARRFLRLEGDEHKNKWLIGDCGAFSYHKEKEPPYTPADMIEFYEDGRFTHGCSVDHIIFEFYEHGDDLVGPSDVARERYDKTLENADQFLALSRIMHPEFTPIGVVQGWSPDSLAEAAALLIKMGYTFLAVGGMAGMRTPQIHTALTAIRERIGFDPDISLHLLGFAKADHLHEFIQYKITSFDSTSPLLRAFKDNKKNYYHLNQTGDLSYYSAIRIPQAIENTRLKNHVRTGLYKQEDLIRLEYAALTSTRQYANRKLELDPALDAILEYSKPLLLDGRLNEVQIERRLAVKAVEYRRTLAERPWESCDCDVCHKIGVEVIIFRTSNRNKRRGIHNLYTYYKHLTARVNSE